MSIETSINSVKVTFDLNTRDVDVTKNVPVNLTSTQQKVLKLIYENPSVTHLEMSQTLSWTEKTAKRTTKVLRELRIIKRVGSDKNGKWILNKI